MAASEIGTAENALNIFPECGDVAPAGEILGAESTMVYVRMRLPDGWRDPGGAGTGGKGGFGDFSGGYSKSSWTTSPGSSPRSSRGRSFPERLERQTRSASAASVFGGFGALYENSAMPHAKTAIPSRSITAL